MSRPRSESGLLGKAVKEAERPNNENAKVTVHGDHMPAFLVIAMFLPAPAFESAPKSASPPRSVQSSDGGISNLKERSLCRGWCGDDRVTSGFKSYEQQSAGMRSQSRELEGFLISTI
jgi:hypothetical protein